MQNLAAVDMQATIDGARRAACVASRAFLEKKPLGYRMAKRSFDVLFSSCVIVFGVIPGTALAVAVAVDTKATPLYRQERMGKEGKPFKILKFRTMVADSDDLEKYLTPEQLDEWKNERKVTDDPRITKLGKFLRATSIDEFPQFMNVLVGQMSVVGCRAITKDELKWFGDDAALLLSLRPGITGLWQTGPRNAVDFESGTRQKVELSYIRNACLSLDARLFFRTFKTMREKTGK